MVKNGDITGLGNRGEDYDYYNKIYYASPKVVEALNIFKRAYETQTVTLDKIKSLCSNPNIICDYETPFDLAQEVLKIIDSNSFNG